MAQGSPCRPWMPLFVCILVGCGGATTASTSTGDGGTVDAPPPDSGPPAPAIWPMFHRTPDHAGRSPTPGPQTGQVRWKTSLGNAVHASPVIGSDGTVYVGDTKGTFYAVRPDGTIAWSTSLGTGISSAAIVDGVVCVAATDTTAQGGSVYGLGPGGGRTWKFGTQAFAELTAASDHTLLFGDAFSLYALRADGTMRWSLNTGDTGVSSPATMPTNGTIVIHSDQNGLFYGVTPDGHSRWELMAGQATGTSTIASDGTSFAVEGDGTVFSITAQGTLNWQKQLGGWNYSTPDIGSDGTLYVSGPREPGSDSGAPDAVLLSISPSSGTVRWRAAVGTWTNLDLASPVMGSDGTLYVGSADGMVYAIAADGTKRWSISTGGPVLSTGAIGTDGTLYIGSDDGNLYAIGP